MSYFNDMFDAFKQVVESDDVEVVQKNVKIIKDMYNDVGQDNGSEKVEIKSEHYGE